MTTRKRREAPLLEPVAGNGLLDRRALLGRGIMFAGAVSTGVSTSPITAAAEPLRDDPWSLETGAITPVLQTPSRFEKDVVRILSNPNGEPRTSHARATAARARRNVVPGLLAGGVMRVGERHRAMDQGEVLRHAIRGDAHGEGAVLGLHVDVDPGLLP